MMTLELAERVAELLHKRQTLIDSIMLSAGGKGGADLMFSNFQEHRNYLVQLSDAISLINVELLRILPPASIDA